MMNNSKSIIGELMSATDFFSIYSVEIPRIQRDYTYGSETEKTKLVLSNILSSIHNALTSKQDLIFDFVYGCSFENNINTKSFQPLDGQQRLTTLFLLYFYAAICANQKLAFSFKYATRDDTTIFCDELMKSFQYSPGSTKISEQIKDSAFYRPSFDDDPSIRSMLVVIDKIEEKFAALTDESNSSYLWNLLNSPECPLKFYCLNIGEFSLSDDLYIKMNARGKQLSEYEIFKSKFEKYIENLDKNLMYSFAEKTDNEYLDLLWNVMGRDKTKIDNAFVYLYKNLFRILGFKKNKVKGKDEVQDNALYHAVEELEINKDDIISLGNFFDVFCSINKDNWCDSYFYTDDNAIIPNQQGKLRFFKSASNPLFKACTEVLKNPQLVSLYAIYVAYKKSKEENWLNNLRHVRNLIEFSDDELGHQERIPLMLDDIDTIMSGGISTIDIKKRKSFNTIQFEEELAKEQELLEWKKLYKYEDHYVLRGTLSLFADPNDFTLSDRSISQDIIKRLETFVGIFNDKSKEKDREIRAHLLQNGDFSQKHNDKDDNCLYGNSFDSWRLLLTPSSYYPHRQIMSVLDTYKSTPPQPGFSDWRYYASFDNYRDYTYVTYNNPAYGFYYFEDKINKPIEVWLLQSSYHGDSNVMWKMMNLILKKELEKEYEVSIDKYKNNYEVLVGKVVAIDCLQEGWRITDTTKNGIIDSWLADNYPSLYNNGILQHNQNEDYIIHIKKVVDALESFLRNSCSETTISKKHKDENNINDNQE